eukprot:gene26926-33577_t
MTDQSLVALCRHSQTLSALDFQESPNITDAGLVKLLSQCILVRELNLKGCQQLTDAVLNGLASISCAALQVLNLAWNTNYTSHALASLLVKCTHMTDLNLGSSQSGVSSDVVETILACCHEMRILDLSGSKAVNGEHVEQMCRQMPALADLNVSNCSHINTGVCIASHSLTRLNLSACTHITDDDVMVLAVSCERLEDLNLKACKKITDYCVTLIVCNCNALRALDVSNCPLISDASLIKLSQCQGLESLGVVDCPEVTLSAV